MLPEKFPTGWLCYLPRGPASWSRPFTVEIETDVFLDTIYEAASWGPVRHLSLTLEGHPTSLSILVTASLHCSLKGVVHTVVLVSWQFLAWNGLHFSEQQ